MAFAAFGIITPVLSVVISVFMLGLALGAWVGGRFIDMLVAKTRISAIGFYGAAELIIAWALLRSPRSFPQASMCY